MLKFRVVAGGHRKGRSLYRHKTSSPTVFTNCVFTIATIAHFECRAVFLHTGSNCYGFDELLEQLRVNFGDITIHRERTQDKSNCIRVSVRSFTNNVLEPSQHQTIIICFICDLLSPSEGAEAFYKDTTQLHYLAKRTRSNILYSVFPSYEVEGTHLSRLGKTSESPQVFTWNQ